MTVFSLAVIIDDFRLERVPAFPREADPPLIINSHAVLALSAALERLEAVRRGNPQVFEGVSIIEHSKFAPRNSLDVAWELSGSLAKPDLLGFFVTEALDH